MVASAIPGNRGLMVDGVHGRLAPPDDPTGLARAILDQWADFDRAVSMALPRGSGSPMITRSLRSPAGTWSCSEH